MAGTRPAEGPFRSRTPLAETPPRRPPREAQLREREEAEAVLPTQPDGADSLAGSLGHCPAATREGQPSLLALCQPHFAEPGYSVGKLIT